MNLFTYGTLMWPEILQAVTGIRAEGERAVLKGYQCLRVKGEVYPVIVESPEDEVAGKLYRDFPDHALSRLDAFEGAQYIRIEVIVSGISAFTYALSPDWMHIAEDVPWNPEDLTPEKRNRFI